MAADFAELMILAKDLGEVPEKTGPKLRGAITGVAFDVKKDAQASVRKRKGLKHAAKAISYELKGFQGFGATVLDAEIGYEKGGVGNLGNLIEFGAPNSGNELAPSHDLGNALLNREDDFEKFVTMAVDDALKEVGL